MDADRWWQRVSDLANPSQLVLSVASTHGSSFEEARTYAVTSLVTTELFDMFSVRCVRTPPLKLEQTFNSCAALVVVAVVVLLRQFFTYVPFMQHFFDTRTVDLLRGVEIIALGIGAVHDS